MVTLYFIFELLDRTQLGSGESVSLAVLSRPDESKIAANIWRGEEEKLSRGMFQGS